MKPLAVRADAKGLEMAYRLAPDVPDALVGDPARLRQILVNLAGNAIKFIERGEVLVEVDRLEPRESPTGSSPSHAVSWHFAVRDTGVGVPVKSSTPSSSPSRKWTVSHCSSGWCTSRYRWKLSS